MGFSDSQFSQLELQTAQHLRYQTVKDAQGLFREWKVRRTTLPERPFAVCAASPGCRRNGAPDAPHRDAMVIPDSRGVRCRAAKRDDT